MRIFSYISFKNRRKFQFEEEDIWVAPPEYVILRKLEYYREGGSEKHLNDIRNILEISQELVDVDFLESKIAELTLNKPWALIGK